MTPQRLAIVEMVFASRSHPTAYHVFEALHDRYPTMSLTTVYKTLHLLESMGEVLTLAADTGMTHYDADVEPHVHLVCRHCGAIADSGRAPADGWLGEAVGDGWQVGHWRLEVEGVCPKCVAGHDSRVPPAAPSGNDASEQPD